MNMQFFSSTIITILLLTFSIAAFGEQKETSCSEPNYWDNRRLQANLPPARYQLKDASISLSRENVGGAGPKHTVTINGKGDVIWNGELLVKEYGVRKKKISKEKFVEILNEIYRIDFFNLKEKYSKRRGIGLVGDCIVEDGTPTVSHYKFSKLSVHLGKYTKSITNIQHPPPGLTELESKIDEITGVSEWIGTKKEIRKATEKFSKSQTFKKFVTKNYTDGLEPQLKYLLVRENKAPNSKVITDKTPNISQTSTVLDRVSKYYKNKKTPKNFNVFKSDYTVWSVKPVSKKAGKLVTFCFAHTYDVKETHGQASDVLSAILWLPEQTHSKPIVIFEKFFKRDPSEYSKYSNIRPLDIVDIDKNGTIEIVFAHYGANFKNWPNTLKNIYVYGLKDNSTKQIWRYYK